MHLLSPLFHKKTYNIPVLKEINSAHSKYYAFLCSRNNKRFISL